MTVVKRARGQTRVSPKHQITIPIEAMRKAGLAPGDRLKVASTRPGRLILVRNDSPVGLFAGRLTDVYPTDALESLRNEWD